MVEVCHTDEQFAIAHLELKDESEFMVALDIVNHLHDRPIVLACVVEHHRMAGLDDGEPLPVSVHIGGETLEDGMIRIGKDAEGTRRYGLLVVLRDGLEHTEVPVVGGKKATHAEIGGIRHQQYALTFFQ